jgi:hypothetical protein
MSDYEKELDYSSLRMGILMNFTPFCGEERTKEAVNVLNGIIAELKETKAELEELKEYKFMYEGLAK